MDLSDLPPSAQHRIAAAEIEADSLFADSQSTAEQLTAEAYRMGVDPSDIGFSPGDIPLDVARRELLEGCERAAGHLFGATAGEYLKAGKLDIEGFNAKLDSIGDWVFQKYRIDCAVLDQMKKECRKAALRKRAAALEAAESKKTIIARLPPQALVRIEAATAVFMAEYVPKLERQANKSGPVHDAKLLRELVVHQFNLVARECIAVSGSAEEFEAVLRSDIAPFVRYALSQYPWLAGPMLQELDTGFTFFVMRANPWAKIPEEDRASVWHVGAITGEGLSHAALKLQAEAWAHAAAGGFPKVDVAGDTKPDGTEPARGQPAKTANGADRRGATWQAIEMSFLSDERVQIHNGTTSETLNYGELGFADRRAKRGTKPKPNQAWVTLRALAEQNGIIRDAAKTGATWPKVEKRIQEIRKALRKHFQIAADPVPFVEGTGYRALFKIGCSPSFHT